MAKYDLKLSNLDELFPKTFSQEQLAKAKTMFLKEFAYLCHKFYGGKIMTVPKAGVYGFNWFNVWYTPGVSKISTTIRDNNDTSFELSNRGNLVAVVSDSTRVLGDGDCTPAGGLGVMEGKAFLMKYLGGVDGVALCVDSYNAAGKHDPDKIIDFVKMVQPSFGAVNLEDISQPNCYKVLDTLREECDIPVWHDDAQGTGCVTLAGLINALKIVGKDIGRVKMVFLGAAPTTMVATSASATTSTTNRLDIDPPVTAPRTCSPARSLLFKAPTEPSVPPSAHFFPAASSSASAASSANIATVSSKIFRPRSAVASRGSLRTILSASG